MADRASRSGIAVPIAVLALSVIGGGVWILSDRSAPLPAPPSVAQTTNCDASDQIVYLTKRFCPGNRIEVYTRAGVYEADENGQGVDVVVDAGRTGTVIGSALSPVTGEPNLAYIQWDAQDWPLAPTGTAALDVFEWTVHADYIRLAP